MAEKKMGKQTVKFQLCPYIIGSAAVVGKKEGQGPMSGWFDHSVEDDMYGEKTWEKAESKMLKEAMTRALAKSGKEKKDIDLVLSGDLLNQLMSSSFMARDLHLPFLGLYGACSTMAESLLLGSMLTDGGFAHNIIVGASSHFCTAERQFRMPVEHGNQRPPSAQWTATAAGAMVVSEKPVRTGIVGIAGPDKISTQRHIRVDCGTMGKIIDAGVKDPNQMGSAMAPAAVDTILNHLDDTGRSIDYYDLILTGDLGYIGKDIACDLLKDAGLPARTVEERLDDCGTMMYYRDTQDVHGGASGCGCSASVFSGNILSRMASGELSRVLLISTGAMLSTISPFQGESIPGIAHAVALSTEEVQ
ncbi:MAG: stage V sporulation protein AD [Firmicutes bacterium]|nr:stage V sporulation protein AD [Bacillota bacterium]